jgi:transcriptional regulator with XRE-family HTH domain
VDDFHQRVVDRIREVAEKRQIPVTHLPDRAGVGRSHFWEVMAGRASPTLAWLEKVAAALDLDPGELVAASPPLNPSEDPQRPRRS